jgi:hypothetical protein
VKSLDWSGGKKANPNPKLHKNINPEPLESDAEDKSDLTLNFSGCNVTNVTIRAIADVLGGR